MKIIPKTNFEKFMLIIALTSVLAAIYCAQHKWGPTTRNPRFDFEMPWPILPT